MKKLFGLGYQLLLSSLVIQGVCLLASFPILYYWGLTSSAAALPCNIIFAPVAALYLTLCAIFFLQSILGFFIPGFCLLLSKVSELWLFGLKLSTKFKLLFVPSIIDFLAWASVLLLIAIIWVAWPKARRLSIGVLPQILVLFCLIRPIFSGKENLVLNSASGHLKIEKTKDGLLKIEDQGYFSRQPIQSSLLNKVRPAILSKFGQRKLKSYSFNSKSKKSKLAKTAMEGLFN